VSVSRKFGTDARAELIWTNEPAALCDTVAGRGDC